MNTLLRAHADAIVKASIQAVLPDNAVRRALENKEFPELEPQDLIPAEEAVMSDTPAAETTGFVDYFADILPEQTTQQDIPAEKAPAAQIPAEEAPLEEPSVEEFPAEVEACCRS